MDAVIRTTNIHKIEPHITNHLPFFLRRDGALQDQIVVTPSLSAVGMETKQLTEENADFAFRDRYHHSSFITTTDKIVHPQSN